jgi:Lar family restriction alleviation protein
MKDRQPCPFCGSIDTFHAHLGYGMFAIQCDLCGADGPEATTKSVATKRWNQRHTVKARAKAALAQTKE